MSGQRGSDAAGSKIPLPAHKGAWSSRPPIINANVPPPSANNNSPRASPPVSTAAPAVAPAPPQPAAYNAARQPNAWTQRELSGVEAVKGAGTVKVAPPSSSTARPAGTAQDSDLASRGRGAPTPANGTGARASVPTAAAGRGRGKDGPSVPTSISSTSRPSQLGFAEELYTTKVPENLPEEKRREAERIAAEIEEESKQKQRHHARSGSDRGGFRGKERNRCAVLHRASPTDLTQ